MGYAKKSRFLPIARNALLLALLTPLIASAYVPSCLTEGFDSASAPVLPSGWTSSVTTASSGTIAPAGTRAAGYTDTGSNAFWFDDYNDYTDVNLTSPVYAVGAVGTPSITFQHSYSLWSADASALYNGVFNGAALEISINGGVYTDVVDAGGSFSVGGYNAILDSNFNNPISQVAPSLAPPYSRSVWGGDSGGFVTTTVVMPASALGGTAQLRWRLGTAGGGRNFSTHSGWWIDSVEYETLNDVILRDDFEGDAPCAH